ncbi:hypothetical protein KXR53_09045 [Inquilinus limosus]|uniref:hypothetical protein n=1 Tax=Inquilinus limosus TaxID=171674 RepID=UPI003F17F710
MTGRGSGDETEARARWFADVMAGRGAGGRPGLAVAVGDHTQALLVELETVFGAGAWIATVILAVAVIEAHLREQAIASGRAVDPYLNAGTLFAEAGLDERFDALRRARNRALHVSDPPTLTVDMHWFEAERLEAEARFAVRLVAAALYGGALPEEPEEEE